MIYPEKGIGKIECSGECDYMDKVHCNGTPNETYIFWTCDNIPAYLVDRISLNISDTQDTIIVNIRDATLADYMFMSIRYVVYVLVICILNINILIY